MKHHSHAAHLNQASIADGKDHAAQNSPSHWLHPESEHVCLLLEELDDAVFQAIRGDAPSLAQAQQLWPKVVSEIGWELVEESREQYLRYAIDLTRQFEEDRQQNPECALAVLEVIELLTKE